MQLNLTIGLSNREISASKASGRDRLGHRKRGLKENTSGTSKPMATTSKQ